MQSNSFLHLPRLIEVVRANLNNTDIVTLDNGLYKVWFARNYETRCPNTLLLDNALATMGAGYASAIIAKKINPNSKVVAVVGDGGLMMNLGDLITAVHLKIDITILVLNDSAYGMIKRKQI
ncbi:MAG: thiamine pyrophosphate-dependent enzyme [Candidatus Cloacimonadota bacterium]|nr:thiamine pyrophosphate-dependent enzyme [Candidatus Cloacimonadota bacterium]